MNNNTITAVFVDKIVARLTEDEERGLIARAQLGETDATERLMLAYAPVLNSAVSSMADRAAGPVSREDLQSEALVGFLECLQAFDLDKYRRLAATVPQYVQGAVSATVTSASGFTVPERTLKRFFSILRKADGNVYEAANLAPEYSLSRSAFLAILSAVRGFVSIESGGHDDEGVALLDRWDARAINEGDVRTPEQVVEDARDVEAAFAAVTEPEADVIRYAYGFADYEPLPDAEVGQRLGISRAAAQRRRTGALDKMRAALGA